MNRTLRTVIVVPMTSKPKGHLSRVPVSFQGIAGELLTDHIRSIDRSRLIRRLGTLDPDTSEALCGRLVEMFQP